MLIDLIRLINENWRERRHRAPWQWLGSEFESVGRLRVLAGKKKLFIFSYNTDNGTPSYYKTQSYIQHPKLLFNKRRQYWSTLNDSSYNLYMAWADFFCRQTSFDAHAFFFFLFLLVVVDFQRRTSGCRWKRDRVQLGPNRWQVRCDSFRYDSPDLGYPDTISDNPASTTWN